MTTPKDITGLTFGRLTAISFAHKAKQHYWLFSCACGNAKIMNKYAVSSGRVLSCGCLTKERCIEAATKHNLYGTRIYEIWRAMKKRCYYSKHIHYSNYGGRGITVCPEWYNSVTQFNQWAINNGYDDKLTIDRIDTNGNYTPENCRWVDYKTQNNNTRTNHVLTHNGVTKTIAEWTAYKGFKKSLIGSRLSKGWSIAKTLETPVNNKKQ